MKNLAPIRKALEDADGRGELVSCLLHMAKRARRLQLGPILSSSHNGGSISLVSEANLEAIEMLPNQEFWSVARSLEDAIPQLDCSYQDVLKLVQSLDTKVRSNGASEMFYVSLVRWFEVNPENARQVVSQAIALDSECLSNCAFAIQGLGDASMALQFLGYENKDLIAVGMRALEILDVTDTSTATQIIDKCCLIIWGEADSSLRAATITTAFRTWEKMRQSNPYRQHEFIGKLVSTIENEDLVQLSVMLFRYRKGLDGDSVEQILKALTSETGDPIQLLQMIDNSIKSRDDCVSFEDVMNVFAAQIPRINTGVESKFFPSFLNWTLDDPRNTSKLFSAWLSGGNIALCSFLSEMVGNGGTERMHIDILRSDLPPNAHKQIYMAEKCIGFLCLHPVTAASILLSVIRNGKKAAREKVEEYLWNPLFVSYGGELREFIVGQLRSSSTRVSRCAHRLVEKQDAYLAGLEEAQHLVELTPSNEQRRKVAARDRQRNHDIQKKAHELSILSKIITRQTLMYGKKTFQVIRDGDGRTTSNIVPLTEMTYSTELPRLHIVDPIGFEILLIRFRNVRSKES